MSNTITVDSRALKSAFSYLKPATKNDDHRHWLHAVHMVTKEDKLILEATDGHRVHTVTLPVNGECEFDTLLAVDNIPPLPTKGEVSVTVSDDTIQFDVASGSRFTSRRVEDQFLKVASVIPQGDPTLVIDIDPKFLAEAAKGFDKRVTLKFFGNTAPVLFTNNAGSATSIVLPLRLI